MMSTLSKKLKAWPVWMLMGILVVALLAVGAGRQSGPLTQEDRIDNVTQRLACPTCDGESVYVSQAPSSQNIRNEVARQVASGQRTDDEIVAVIESSFGGQVLLVPRATGLDALIWVLPIAVLVCCTAGLVLTFRRWKREQGGEASDADRALVAQLLELDTDPTESL